MRVCQLALPLCALALFFIANSNGAESALSPADQAATAALREKLQRPVNVDAGDTTLLKALETLAKRADFKLAIAGREDRELYQKRINVNLENVRPVDVLETLKEIAPLHYEVKPGVLRISNASDRRERNNVFAAYALDDLLAVLPDFPPQPETLSGSPLFSSYGGEDNPFRRNPFSVTATPTLTNIGDMFRVRIAPKSWDAELGTSVEERSGVLLVVNTPEVHGMIRRLLAGFRARSNRQVGLDARVIVIKSADLDRVRRESEGRGTPRPELDAEALAALDKLVQEGAAAQLFDGSTTMFSTQMGLLQDLRENRYLTDYEISGDSYDSVVRSIYTGTVVSAIPILSDDDQIVDLSLRVAHLEPAGAVENAVVQRGGLIPNISGSGSSITIKRKTTKDEKNADKKVEDLTSEFEIQQSQPTTAVQTFGPLRVQLPSVARSRLAQDVLIRAGRTVAVTAPYVSKDGLGFGKEMLVLARCQPLVAADRDLEPERRDVTALPENLALLLEKKIDVAFIEQPVQKILETLASQYHLPLVIDRERLGSRLQNRLTVNQRDSRIADILNGVFVPADAALLPYNSLLLVTTAENVRAKRLTLRVFDIRDLTKAHLDYSSVSTMAGVRQAAAGASINPFASPPDFTNRGLRAADYAEVIKRQLLPDDFTGDSASIEESANKLIVVNTPEAIQRVAQALQELRKSARFPINVMARWATVNTTDLKTALGGNAPQLLNPKAANAVLELLAQPRSRDLCAARVVCFSNQRVSAFGVTEKAIVADFDISGMATDPVISSAIGGVTMDVKPIIIEGAGGDSPMQFMIETRLNLSRTDTSAMVDPIASKDEKDLDAKVFATAPAAPGKLHTPKTQSQDINTTVQIVDGGAVLFRLPVPEWLENENPDEIKRGQRVMIVLLQAQQQKQ